MNRFFRIIFLCFLFHINTIISFSQVSKVEIPNGYFVFTFQEDTKGNIWLGLSDGNNSGGLGVYNNNNFSLVSGSDSIPTGSYHTSLKLSDGSLLFAGNVLNKQSQSLLIWISEMGIDTLQIPFKLQYPLINNITLVKRRDIWIGTTSGLLINSRGDWSWLTTRDRLPNNSISAVYQDFRGVIWIGTDSGIAYFFEDQLYLPESGSRIISSATNFYGDTRGYVWCGARFASEGVSVFNGEVWETFSGRNGLIDNSVSYFYQDNEANLWVGSCYSRSRGGVSVFDGKKWSGFDSPQFLAKPCVDAIISDARGRIWFGGSLSHNRYKGITILDGDKWYKITNNIELPAERVILFFKDSLGNIWISSMEGLFIVGKDFEP